MVVLTRLEDDDAHFLPTRADASTASASLQLLLVMLFSSSFFVDDFALAAVSPLGAVVVLDISDDGVAEMLLAVFSSFFAWKMRKDSDF